MSNNTTRNIVDVEYRVSISKRKSFAVSSGEYADLLKKNIITNTEDKLVNLPNSSSYKRLVSGTMLKAYLDRCMFEFRYWEDANGKVTLSKLVVYVRDWFEQYVSAYVARALASFLGKMIKHKALYN